MASCDYALWRFDEARSFTANTSDGSKSVAFNIRCTENVSKWVVFQDTAQKHLLRRISRPLPEASVLVDCDQLGLAEQILDRQLALANWPIPAPRRREMIDDLLRKARETVQRLPPHHKSAQLHFGVDVTRLNVVDGHREMERLLTTQRSMEESSGAGDMVPAEESSIESLEKTRFTDQDSGDCSVCLEEMLLGSQVTSMPCAHVFHGDCIQKWLRTSRYCPVCRFEMPTS